MSAYNLGEALPKLVDRIVASYRADPRTQHIDKRYLPSTAAIVHICDLLLELTYPGYFGRLLLTQHNIAYHVGDLLPRLWEALADQVQQCICHEREERGDLPADSKNPCREVAESLATQFVELISDVRERLADDVQAAYDGDPAATGTPEIILSYPGVLAVTIYRYAHELHQLGVPLMPRMMSEHAHRETGIDIHPGATIGRSFFIDHGTGAVIGETSVIGDNVKLYQGVTLGALSFPKDARGRVIRGTKRHPTLGNSVTIYANAAVLGGETRVGDRCVVGGSVFLAHSVEPGHMVSITPPILKVRAPQVPSKLYDGVEPSWDI